jgi:tRNA pseudouridine55 synthase
LEILNRSCILADPAKACKQVISPEGALVLLQKPYGETSFHVVNRIRKAISLSTGIRKIKCGHAGTLDPLATGLLIIATRYKTKELANLIGLDKTYRVKMRLGVTSASFDLEQPIEISENAHYITKEAVELAINDLPGEHEQIPPIYSAIKQGGQPVYHAARKGRIPIMVARTIFVHNVEIISIELPYITFRARVSKGTYIRSLVRDIAVTLGTGGILSDLEREAIGEWKAENALTLDEALNLIREMPLQLADHFNHS